MPHAPAIALSSAPAADRLAASITSFVRGVEAHLETLLPLPPQRRGAPGRDLWLAARHTCLADRAKRVRPRLVHLFGGAVDAEEQGLVDVAAAAELIHAASLVHDDVIDHGTVRRGRPTVNAEWDNLRAVLCGDLLFSVSFRQLRRHRSDILVSAVDIVREMSCAAIDEVSARGHSDLAEADWRAVAEGKAGSLFGWCGVAAALLADDEEAAQRFDRCGRALGIAFQLADDLKDLIGHDGKDPFADIRNKNPSWPLLWARDHDEECAARLRAAWAAPEVDLGDARALGRLVIERGAAAAAERAVRGEIEVGLAELGPYRDRPQAALLASWAEALVPRVGAGSAEDG